MAVELRCETAAGSRGAARALVTDARRLLRLSGLESCELSVALVDDAAIRELNRTFRAKDEPTDVLSFSQIEETADGSTPAATNNGGGPRPAGRLPEGLEPGAVKSRPGLLLGDVVISLETARAQALRMGVTERQRLRTLLVHGFLHLLGYDHERSIAGARRMFRRERELGAMLAACDRRPGPPATAERNDRPGSVARAALRQRRTLAGAVRGQRLGAPGAAMLTHFTRARGGSSALDNLVAILREGVIHAATRMVRGPEPAVCLFDATLGELADLLANRNRRRYEPFGVALGRRYAFRMGARPVIYVPLAEARRLLAPQELWRVVSIDLDRTPAVDWCFEREWRIRGDLRIAPQQAVALVRSWGDADEVFDRFDGHPPCAGVLPLDELCARR